MPRNEEEATPIRHVKHIHTGKVFEWNQRTRIVNHNMEWKINNV